MKWIAVLTALALLSPGFAVAKPGIAAVSYWGPKAESFARIPDHSLALINPDSGIFTAEGQTRTLAPSLDRYLPITEQAARHDIALYGYVPTGYFNHSCDRHGKCQTWDRIEAQVKAYFEALPGLRGIFFDEAAPADYDCQAFAAEYAKLRAIVAKYRTDGRIIYNVGFPDTCAVKAAVAGDMVVLFESDGRRYVTDHEAIQAATDLARSRGVLTWHIVNDVPTVDGLGAVVQTAGPYAPDYLYVVDVSGDWQAGFNTYGAIPAYWREEVEWLASPPP
ncbi:MAG: hypothetical protein JF615_07190 [Asticcacaulis sp.]|nr:hypothetical protein [Asticcacaulis sp.]